MILTFLACVVSDTLQDENWKWHYIGDCNICYLLSIICLVCLWRQTRRIEVAHGLFKNGAEARADTAADLVEVFGGDVAEALDVCGGKFFKDTCIVGLEMDRIRFSTEAVEGCISDGAHSFLADDPFKVGVDVLCNDGLTGLDVLNAISIGDIVKRHRYRLRRQCFFFLARHAHSSNPP